MNTTLAKQLANWVILYSPLQMASDMIEHYEGHPAFQFFRDFDPDCDESKALAGDGRVHCSWYVKQKAIISWEQLPMKAPVL